MKKLFALILALAILSLSVFGLAACNNNKPDDGSSDTDDTDKGDGSKDDTSLDGNGGNKDKNDGSEKSRAIAVKYNGSAEQVTYSVLDTQDELWFEFTPETSATYRIQALGLDGNYSIQLLEGNGNKLLAKAPEVQYSLQANEKYSVKVLQLDGCNDNSFALFITNTAIPGTSPYNAYNLSIGSNPAQKYACTAETVPVFGSAVWFKFTPSESATYSLTLTDFEADTAEILFYDSELYRVDSVKASNAQTQSLTRYMDAGKTYYYVVSMTGAVRDPSFGADITAEPRGTVIGEVHDITLEDNSVHEYSGSEVWLKYTPTEDGCYTFKLTEMSADAYAYLYDDDLNRLNRALVSENFVTHINGNPHLTYNLTAGRTYYYQIKSYYGTALTDTSFGIDLTFKPQGGSAHTAYPLSFGTNATQSYATLADGSSVCFKFTPKDSADYVFKLVDANQNYTPGLSSSSDDIGFIITPSDGIFSLNAWETCYIHFGDITNNDDFGIIVETVE